MIILQTGVGRGKTHTKKSQKGKEEKKYTQDDDS